MYERRYLQLCASSSISSHLGKLLTCAQVLMKKRNNGKSWLIPAPFCAQSNTKP